MRDTAKLTARRILETVHGLTYGFICPPTLSRHLRDLVVIITRPALSARDIIHTLNCTDSLKGMK